MPLAHHPAPDNKAVDANARQNFILEERHRQLVVFYDGAHHFGVLGDAAMLGLGEGEEHGSRARGPLFCQPGRKYHWGAETS